MGKLRNNTQAAQAQMRVDNWVNLVTGLGDVSRDRIAAGSFQAGSQKDAQYYETLFAEDPLAHRIGILPPSEALRQGFNITGIEQGFKEKLEERYNELGADTALIEAMGLGRALGGAAVFIGADDGQDPSQPLDPERVRDVIFLKVLTRRNLQPATFYTDPLLAKFGEPETYQMQRYSSGGGSGGVTALIHESRLLIFEGTVTSDERRARNQGWADSIYLQTEESLRAFWGATQGMANALSDADQAVFKLDGLLDIIKGSGEGDDAIRRRLMLLQHGRSVARAIAVDARSESFEYIARQFAGYDTGLYALMYVVSAACGIPVTLLFGRSPAGMNSTGEGDITFFYDTIKAFQTRVLQPPLKLLVSLIGNTVGQMPEGWGIKFNPLRQLTDLEKADVRLKTAQADEILINTNVISPEEARQSHFGGEEFDTAIEIDESTAPEVPSATDNQAGQTGSQGTGNRQPMANKV